MSADRQTVRRAFVKPTVLLVRVTPDGFLIDEDRLHKLQGRIAKQRLLRKRFEDGQLACDSTDGIRAQNGTLCEQCLHPRCRPWLRIHLASGGRIYILDLAVTSAQNLLELDDQAAAAGAGLHDWTLKLTVENRGSWGEVCFQRV